MFVAVNQAGATINLLVEKSQKNFEKQPYFCPICQQKVILKQGKVKLAHFAHRRSEACLIADFENETIEHLTGKARLFNWLKQQVTEVYLEYYLPEIKQRPDIFFVLDGERYAIEWQCSPLSIDLLRDRSKAYKESGIHFVWVLGGKLAPKKALTALQRGFCQYDKQLGFYLWHFDIEQHQLICYQQIALYSFKQELYYCQRQLAIEALTWQQLFFPEAFFTRKTLSFRRETTKQRVTGEMIWLQRKWQYQVKSFMGVQENLYLEGQHLDVLPLAIHFPKWQSLMIHTPDVIWRVAVLLFLREFTIGACITYERLLEFWQELIETRQLVIYTMPCCQFEVSQYLENFLMKLVDFGILVRNASDFSLQQYPVFFTSFQQKQAFLMDK